MMLIFPVYIQPVLGPPSVTWAWTEMAQCMLTLSTMVDNHPNQNSFPHRSHEEFLGRSLRVHLAAS